MQPTYLYASDMDREMQWRSKFSMIIPILLGFAQMILTFAIVGLEIASVVISAREGTLYAGFWLSVIFTLSWIAMFTLGIEVKQNENKFLVHYRFFVSCSLFSLLSSFP